MKKITSLKELAVRERKKVQRTARGIGLLTCALGIATLYFINIYPFIDGKGFFFWINCLLSLNPPVLLFALGYVLGEFAQLADLGYLRSYQVSDSGFNENPSFGSNETISHRPYSFNSPMSINPASGLPMSGSSGMDSRGNPFGTNSW